MEKESSQYHRLSPWAYVGYGILFSIPLAGEFTGRRILAIIFSLSDDNLNCRNFARAYWCGILLVFVIAVVLTVAGISLTSAANR